MNPELLRALDLAITHDWAGAAAKLQQGDGPVAERLAALFADLDRQDESRRRTTARVRHEIGNALTIIQANLEGVIDGVLEPTTDRLAGMCDALASAGAALENLGRP
jgi:two-component system sensor histidine kinase BaeS